ncbi:MAG: ABC transporter ATP-binding protein [Chloracidobacterium sp.]|uniref:ABC transporter ATP-binding protein n=1 Tax=Chloracidobacterium validum TaxID=2821543 RepID=A0ABX8B5Q4_9BACT|nr:ABC transporter ATP-binding protein [Chloracidobacterium validum]QUW02306.1 ABC transporter ATP-binding protein [Chloracidobacterium validum]
MPPVVEIEHLSMEYVTGFWRNKRAKSLVDVSLEVYEGEVFGFLGHNGAGKTTTLKILMRIVYPTGGTARILGRPLDDLTMRRRIGYLPETPYFYDYLTGRELLDYFGRLCGLDADQRAQRIRDMLALVSLQHAADRPLRKYSKGMLQRIGIAQALLHDPDVVFLDEPMTGLDPIGRREVRDIIAGLRDRGKTVFFSTHILSDVEALCDRIAILKQGRRVAYGTLAEIQAGRSVTLEIVATETTPETVQALEPYAARLRQTAAGLHCELKSASQVSDAVAALHHHGGRLVSITPIKSALEEFFIRDEAVNEVA